MAMSISLIFQLGEDLAHQAREHKNSGDARLVSVVKMLLGNKEVTLIQEMVLYTYPDRYVIVPVKPVGIQEHVVVSRAPNTPDCEIMSLRGMYSAS